MSDMPIKTEDRNRFEIPQPNPRWRWRAWYCLGSLEGCGATEAEAIESLKRIYWEA